jgi:hypothetical protein
VAVENRSTEGIEVAKKHHTSKKAKRKEQIEIVNCSKQVWFSTSDATPAEKDSRLVGPTAEDKNSQVRNPPPLLELLTCCPASTTGHPASIGDATAVISPRPDLLRARGSGNEHSLMNEAHHAPKKRKRNAERARVTRACDRCKR